MVLLSIRNKERDLDLYPDELGPLVGEFDDDIMLLMDDLEAGNIDADEWRDRFAAMLAGAIALAYFVGMGGTIITADQRAAIDAMLAEQLAYLDKFYDVVKEGIKDGEFDPAWRSRASMYADAVTEPFWEARTWPWPLPAYPGDGTSQCVVSSNSRLYTRRGMIPICDIKIGDYVLTHTLNFRRVTAAWTTRAGVGRKFYSVCAPNSENSVLFTGDHRLLTEQGWQTIDDIHISSSNVLYLTHEKLMPLWSTERYSSEAMFLLRQPREGIDTMGKPGIAAGINTGSPAGYRSEGTPPGKRFETQICENVGEGAWADSQRVCDSPFRSQSQERRFIQFGGDVSGGSPTFTQTADEVGYLFDMRGKIQTSRQGNSSERTEILFCGVLSPETTLYDITVEGDESFVIENIIAHNCLTHCRCDWVIQVIDEAAGDADAFWMLGPVEHCQTCIERARRWNPLQIRNWRLPLYDTISKDDARALEKLSARLAQMASAVALKHLQGKHDQQSHGRRGASSDIIVGHELDEDQADAIGKYTGELYDDINSALRSGKLPSGDISDAVSAIDVSFGKVAKSTTVYRGLDATHLNQLKPGDKFTERGYSSASSDYRIAQGRADKGFKVVMEVRLKRGQEAMKIPGRESEILLPRDSQFRFVKEKWMPEPGGGGHYSWIVDLLNPIYKITTKHLAGKHDQSRHGQRFGDQANAAQLAARARSAARQRSQKRREDQKQKPDTNSQTVSVRPEDVIKRVREKYAAFDENSVEYQRLDRAMDNIYESRREYHNNNTRDNLINLIGDSTYGEYGRDAAILTMEDLKWNNDGTITLYRGGALGGQSWSTDIEWAKRFSVYGFGGPGGANPNGVAKLWKHNFTIDQLIVAMPWEGEVLVSKDAAMLGEEIGY